MTNPTEAPTEYDAMKMAGPEFSASTVVSSHCIYRNLPPAKDGNPECAVKSAQAAGSNTVCSSPTGTEKSCSIARGWNAEAPINLFFDEIP